VAGWWIDERYSGKGTEHPKGPGGGCGCGLLCSNLESIGAAVDDLVEK
jgi:hypothetical protein